MLIPSPGHFDENFGATLCARGDWLLVGEKFGRAAFLYSRASGWTERIPLSPAGIPATAFNLGPGMGVAVDTDVAVVAIHGGQVEPRVYIFEQISPGIWSENPNPILNFKTGEITPIALGHDAAGAFLAVLNGATEANLISVYRKPPSTGTAWPLAYVLTAPAGADLKSIAATNDRIVVGAPAFVLPSGQVGAAFVFDAAAGAGPLELPVTPLPAGGFGTSVAIDRDHLIVGTYGGADGGSAYVYDLSSATASPTRLTSPAGAGQYFGKSVDIQGGLAVIGEYFAPPDTTHGYMGGKVWLADAASDWAVRETPMREHGSGPMGLGYSVGVSGPTVFGGANDFNAGNGGVFVEDEASITVPFHFDRPIVAIDPLAMLLSPSIYVRLTLPDPPPIIVREIRAVIKGMSPAQRKGAIARVERAHAHAEALLIELNKR